MDEYEFEQRLRETLERRLMINHSYRLNNRGQKFIKISINFGFMELTSTEILIGQEKDLHDYSTNFEPQILPQ